MPTATRFANRIQDMDDYASALTWAGKADFAGTVDIYSGPSGGAVPETWADDLVIEHSADCGISILSPGTTTQSIFFGDDVNPSAAGFRYNHATDTLYMDGAGEVRMILLSDGRISVGSTLSLNPPIGVFHICTATQAVTPSADADELVVEGGADAGISILSSGTGRIVFGDTPDADIGQLRYDHATDKFIITVNAADCLVVDSSGNVGIGVDPGTLLELASTGPIITLWNTNEEDADSGRESQIIFEGEQSGGEHTTLAKIYVSHDGTGDDQKGLIGLYTNDGTDDDIPTLAMEIDSGQNTIFHGSIWQSDGKYVATDEVRARDGDGLYLLDDGGNGIFIQDGGNVGIRTVAPPKDLTLDGTFRARQSGATRYRGDLYFSGGEFNINAYDDTGVTYIPINLQGSFIQFKSGTTNIARITSTGLGIGTTAPNSLLELGFATENLEFVDAGSAGATEQDWVEVQVGGVTGYVRVYATK